ncbi:hypothetical protein [Luteipulveratus flavus]|uniref:DUF202 domain-containing protein n=1 Tax=Luteipulveratus flavus TaxID=3031728 RepID=A0ABT6C4S3_9MICO|nr:hypothetical protein [Luteipulveratus sp. YIM 133296]MDF8263548.1 hypothetical protein [Luteipulveratus sp. YIM 133296]
METTPQSSPGPNDAVAQLEAADLARQRLAADLRLPSGLHAWLGAAVAVQVATAAFGIAAFNDDDRNAWELVLLAAGCAVFAVVALVQIARFRRLNRATVGGWVSQAVLGSSNLASVAYGGGLAATMWAAFSDHPVLAVAAALATGAAYAAAAHHWWRAYRSDPARHARGASRAFLAACVLAAVVGLVALLVASR